MRNFSKRFTSFFLAFVLALCMVPAAYAAIQDGLSVELITDKESYEIGEEVAVSVVAKNTGTKLISNVQVNLDLPEGVKLKEGYSSVVTFGTLQSNEEQKVEIVKVEASESVGGGQNADNSNGSNDSNGSNGSNTSDSPVTGDFSLRTFFLLLAAASCGAAVICMKKNRKAVNICVGVLILSLVGLAVPTVASAALISGEFTLEKTIKVGGKDVVITAKVTYQYESELEEDSDNTENDSTGDNNAESSTTGSGSSEEATTGSGSSEEATTGSGSSEEATTGSGSSEEATTGNGSSEEATTGNGSSEEATTESGSSEEETTTGNGSSEEVTTESGSSEEETTTGNGSSEEATTESGSSEEETTTGNGSSEEATTESGSSEEETTTGNGSSEEETTEPSEEETPESPVEEEIARVSVHDPSIVKDPDTGRYYIFGSHMAWAYSDDLINWTEFKNNINTDYNTLFAKEAEWSALGGTQDSSTGKYEVSGNLWAPDVIWNEDMGKWCMYMSVNGDYWYTSIVLLTSDSLDGDWKYVGPVVYSGFTSAEQAAKTDFAQVMGSNDVPDRYIETRNGRVRTYGMNAIDPCVKYDEDGNLWMSYGSWFGGIYMLKLDNVTGLRDYDYEYDLIDNESDPYQGIKIAGGQGVSGEASYLEKIGDYWYLFMSYGGLVSTGGYNMRVFRSAEITGPYVDESGDSARYAAAVADNVDGTVGIKLLGNYQWNTMKVGQVAQGHNSAIVDSDGKAYVVYHTRFADGTEGHQVRVHQLFVNEDGWLVAAPYEYAGETLSDTAYSMEEMAGSYEVIFHTQKVDYANLVCNTPKDIVLNENGTVSGAYTGTWESDSDTPYVTLTLGGHEYKGVFIKQQVEDTTEETMCFTVLGDDEVEVWGSKYITGKTAVDTIINNGMITIPLQTVADIDFQTTALWGTTISYASKNTAVITNDGKVTRGDEDVDVIVTATFTNSGYSYDKEYTIRVLADKGEDERLLVGQYYTDEAADLSKAVEGTYQFPNLFNKSVTNGLELYDGATIEFDIEGTGTYLSNILSFYGGGRMYFTGGSYLGYNATGGFFDANVTTGLDWYPGTDYIKGNAHIEIKLKSSGFEVYANGELAYDSTQLEAGSIPGGKDLASYYNVLQWLNNTAETINFGWGSWWPDNFNGKISNVKLYAEPAEFIDTTGYVYYKHYSDGDISDWATSISGLAGLALVNVGNEYGNYVNFAANSGDTGNRSISTVFPSDVNLEKNYTIEMDFKMTSGNVADRSNSELVILGTDADKTTDPLGGGVTSGYILKLSTKTLTTSAITTNYYVNDGTQMVTIPKDTWVHLSVTVDGNGNVSAVLSYEGNVENISTTVNGKGILGGIYILRGRGTGTASIDNIRVKEEEADSDDDNPEEAVKPVYFYDFATGLSSTGTVTGEATAATIVGSGKLVNDSERGQVFDNCTGTTAQMRVNYLSLPKEIGNAISGFESKAFTISMWIKSPESNNNTADPYAYHSPLFTMKDANATTFYPIVNVGLKGTSQVNWAGWIDNTLNPDPSYIEDNAWHHVAATFSAAGTTVYLDGNIYNTASSTDTLHCMGIFGADIWTSVNIGGNQAWEWNDVDAHLYYDDVAIYDVALSQEEISALINQ